MASRTPQRSWLASACFRLMLTLSLWQAPIVWGHQHPSESSGLADHIARFHGEDSQIPCLGWHWHISLPDWMPTDGTDHSHCSSVRIVIAVPDQGASASVLEQPSALIFVEAPPFELPRSLLEPQGGVCVTRPPVPSPRQMLCRLNS